jgi:dephospho-CoA kinase
MGAGQNNFVLKRQRKRMDKNLNSCIFIVGLQGSGKSTFLEIARGLGYSVADWGNILREDLNYTISDRSRAFDYVGEVIESVGVEHYPKLIFDKLCSTGRTFHVVAGPRNPLELRYFRTLYKDSKVIWISTNYLLRYRRSADRCQHNHTPSLKTFLIHDFHELASGLAEIASQADDIILNDGSMENFHRCCNDFLENFFIEEGSYE